MRPGFIVGPGDPTDRFTFWPVRIDKGGEVLAPGDGTDAVQFIDVRDLSEWIVRLAENADYDIYNGVGPSSTLSMAEMLYGIRAVTSKDVKFTWLPIPFLRENDVKLYSDMPRWFRQSSRTSHRFINSVIRLQEHLSPLHPGYQTSVQPSSMIPWK